MLKYAVAVLMLCTTAQAQDFDAVDAASIVTPTEEIVRLWEEADEDCRGGHGDQAATYGACAARDVYMEILEERHVDPERQE